MQSFDGQQISIRSFPSQSAARTAASRAIVSMCRDCRWASRRRRGSLQFFDPPLKRIFQRQGLCLPEGNYPKALLVCKWSLKQVCWKMNHFDLGFFWCILYISLLYHALVVMNGFRCSMWCSHDFQILHRQAFGQHTNAEISSSLADTDVLMQTMIEVRGGGGVCIGSYGSYGSWWKWFLNIF